MHPTYSLIAPTNPSGGLLPLRPRVRYAGANRWRAAGSKRHRYRGLVHAEAAGSNVIGSGNAAARASRTDALRRQLAQLESAISELDAELASYSNECAPEDELYRWGDMAKIDMPPSQNALTSARARGRQIADTAKEERTKFCERVEEQRQRVGDRVSHEYERLPPDARNFLETSSRRAQEWKASVRAAVPPVLEPLLRNRFLIGAAVAVAVLLAVIKWFSEMRKDSR